MCGLHFNIIREMGGMWEKEETRLAMGAHFIVLPISACVSDGT